MIDIESLQKKRAVLMAQREQQIANINVTVGAIAQLDELLGEAKNEVEEANAHADADRADSEEPTWTPALAKQPTSD